MLGICRDAYIYIMHIYIHCLSKCNLFLIYFKERSFHALWRCLILLKHILKHCTTTQYLLLFFIPHTSFYLKMEYFGYYSTGNQLFFRRIMLVICDTFLDSLMLSFIHNPWNISGLHCLWTWEYISFAVPSWERCPRVSYILY